MKRAYLFDFDGTLVDTMEGFADIAGEVINRFNPEMSIEIARAAYLETSGVPFYQQLEIIFPGDPTNIQKVEYFERVKQEGFFRTRFSQSVKHTIRSLRERGDYAGVSSNNFQELIDRFISMHDLEFDIVMGYIKGFEKGKDHFDHAIETLKIRREDLTFVGDSLKDAEKAVSNNIRFVGLCGTFTREQFRKNAGDVATIESIEELLSL